LNVLTLFVQAPFAAFRTFTAGWYRPTAAFLTPSAAYGLALNVAGIETRRDDGLSAMTVTMFDLPPMRIALGADPSNPRGPFPRVQTLYQQIHNYPVGVSGKERKDDAKGNKYNITPVRRELLADLRAYISLEAGPHLEELISARLSGARREPRYGLPFMGDNAFLLDRLEICDGPVKAHWYRRLGPDDEASIVPHTTRLTIWVDRQDMSKTRSALYAPLPEATDEIPEMAWTEIQPNRAPTSVAKKKEG
jgi:CRISPR-associated protein Cas5t